MMENKDLFLSHLQASLIYNVQWAALQGEAAEPTASEETQPQSSCSPGAWHFIQPLTSPYTAQLPSAALTIPRAPAGPCALSTLCQGRGAALPGAQPCPGWDAHPRDGVGSQICTSRARGVHLPRAQHWGSSQAHEGNLCFHLQAQP